MVPTGRSNTQQKVEATSTAVVCIAGRTLFAHHREEIVRILVFDFQSWSSPMNPSIIRASVAGRFSSVDSFWQALLVSALEMQSWRQLFARDLRASS
jgi:hypothetical protein